MTAQVLTFEAEQETAQPQTPTPAAPIPDAQPITLEKPTVLLNLKLGKPGNSRKGDMSQVDTDAEKDALRLSKELLDSPELKAINKADGELRAWIYKKALPSMFRAGVYRLPLEMLARVDDRLKSHEWDREQLIQSFINWYPIRKRDARDRLRSQFREEDYPAPEAIAQTFTMQWSYLTMATPTDLGSISREIYEREQIKAQELAQAEAQQIRDALRQTFGELISHMIERLTPGEDGKPKVFKDSTVKNFQEFLADFSARNVTGDGELDELVRQAQNLTAGMSADYLRQRGPVKDSIRQGLDKMKPLLDAMVADAPRRGIILD